MAVAHGRSLAASEPCEPLTIPCTNLRYLRRYRQVRSRSTPKWLEWALGLWSAVALFSIGFLLDGTIGYSFTLGGIVGAVPFLLWAERPRRTA
jgi:membrane associated rhomboid family serine protease